MYKDASKKPKAASKPSERDYPFSMENHYKGERKAQNDPVGTQSYASNAYGQDDRANWVDRS